MTEEIHASRRLAGSLAGVLSAPTTTACQGRKMGLDWRVTAPNDFARIRRWHSRTGPPVHETSLALLSPCCIAITIMSYAGAHEAARWSVSIPPHFLSACNVPRQTVGPYHINVSDGCTHAACRPREILEEPRRRLRKAGLGLSNARILPREPQPR